jgi:hypothetical protein
MAKKSMYSRSRKRTSRYKSAPFIKRANYNP